MIERAKENLALPGHRLMNYLVQLGLRRSEVDAVRNYLPFADYLPPEGVQDLVTQIEMR
jgi:hypothetical protein